MKIYRRIYKTPSTNSLTGILDDLKNNALIVVHCLNIAR